MGTSGPTDEHGDGIGAVSTVITLCTLYLGTQGEYPPSDRDVSESLSAEEARTELYRRMTEHDSFEAKANAALALGCRYLGVENGHLTRIDTDSNHWKALYSTDSSDGQFPPGLVLELGTTYCRRTVEDGPVQLSDAAEQGWEDDPAYEQHELPTYHGTTLVVDDEPYGTVCFVDRETRGQQFTDEETMFVELITRMLESELKRERTEEQIQRLDQFASVVSHDLRNPLSVARGNVEMAREQYDNPEELETASRALDRMETLIEDVLSLARQSQDIEETASMRLSATVDNCWESVESHGATVAVTDDCTFKADERLAKQIFENLFRNALEHGGEEVSIRVGQLADGDGFYVEDSGPGIPPGDREAVFDTGFSTSENGVGLGLSIVDGAVSAHGWEIAVTEGALGGARFEISNVIIEKAE